MSVMHHIINVANTRILADAWAIYCMCRMYSLEAQVSKLKEQIKNDKQPK